jgi:hypothetical protein
MPAGQRSAAEMTALRFRYEETGEPTALIAKHHRMNKRTLHRMARREGWRPRARRPPRDPQAHAPRPRPRPDEVPRDVERLRRALIERLQKLAAERPDGKPDDGPQP